MMRKALLGIILGAMALSQTGCLIPIYDGDPNRRTVQLIHTSDNLRMVLDEWERIWFLDQPSHLSPYRTHGGII